MNQETNTTNLIKVAGVIIKNIDGKYLMCHPTNHPDVWSMTKGHVEEGENPLEAAIRETYEECNLDIKKLKGEITLVGSIEYNIPIGRKHLSLYLFKSQQDLKSMNIKCNSSFIDEHGNKTFEMDNFKWMDYEEVMNKGMRFVKNFFKTYKHIL